jgi:hypothetical protein
MPTVTITNTAATSMSGPLSDHTIAQIQKVGSKSKSKDKPKPFPYEATGEMKH